jgi:GntR family transcriptional regulator
MAAPMYRQIAEDLRQRIESGELPPGSQLPTEQELREQYDNASRNTVRDAIRWLTTRRMVETQAGRGTFVVEQPKPFIVPLNESEVGGDEGTAFEEAVVRQKGKPRLSRPRVEVQEADRDIARELQVEKGTMIVSRHQERLIGTRPSSLQTSFYPMDFVEHGATDLLIAADIKDGATKYVERELGIKQTGYRDRLRVRTPNSGEVRFFEVPDDGTVLMVVTHRTAYAQDGKPIRYTVTTYPADRNQFVIEFGDVPSLLDLIEEL